MQKDKYVKDGIHLIFTTSIHKAVQVLLRDNIINEIKTMWDDLPITNQFDDVFDIGITPDMCGIGKCMVLKNQIVRHINWLIYLICIQ